MAKWQNDLVLDAACDYIKNNTTQVAVCTSQPTTYAEATATYKLALKTGLTASNFTGAANGDVSGRKITCNAISSLTVDTGGTALHIALCSGTVLLYVTTMTSQVLTASNTCNIPAFDIEFLDVTP